MAAALSSRPGTALALRLACVSCGTGGGGALVVVVVVRRAAFAFGRVGRDGGLREDLLLGGEVGVAGRVRGDFAVFVAGVVDARGRHAVGAFVVCSPMLSPAAIASGVARVTCWIAACSLFSTVICGLSPLSA